MPIRSFLGTLSSKPDRSLPKKPASHWPDAAPLYPAITPTSKVTTFKLTNWFTCFRWRHGFLSMRYCLLSLHDKHHPPLPAVLPELSLHCPQPTKSCISDIPQAMSKAQFCSSPRLHAGDQQFQSTAAPGQVNCLNWTTATTIFKWSYWD